MSVLKKIAWVNIQKLPSATGTITNMRNIRLAFSKYGNLIQKQIELLDPHVIICGGTFEIICNSISSSFISSYGNTDLRKASKNERIIVDANHPSRKGKVYICEILKCVKNGLVMLKQSKKN